MIDNNAPLCFMYSIGFQFGMQVILMLKDYLRYFVSNILSQTLQNVDDFL